ncbi:MAG: NUDIX hydrolase [Chloroflexota bacterium]
MAGLRSETATSAGGIVISAAEDGRPSLVVGLRRRDGDRRRGTWTLPKGTPDPGETIEQTALREVEEETGLQVRILEPLPSISYVFVQNGSRISKTVHYWLMEPVGGDLSLHDREFERVRWVPFDEVAEVLTFETERSLVDAAARVVQATMRESAPGGQQRSTNSSGTVAP